MQVGAGGLQRRSSRSAASGPSRAQPAQRQSRDKSGNAVYRIDADGFVHEIFRESVMILHLQQVGDRLLVATGNEGQIYSVDRNTRETTILADLQPEQIPALTRQSDGTVLLATANPARLLKLSRNVAKRGTYTSPIMDASQVSLWGMLHLTANIRDQTSVTLETRSGNVGNPTQGAWSKWSRAQALMPNADRSPMKPRQMKVQSPPARFLQYRLTLTGQQRTSPTIKGVELAYVTPNLAPSVQSLTFEYPDSGNNRSSNSEAPAPKTQLNIQWESSDPNDDRLLHKVEYRRAGSNKWIAAETDLRQNSYQWQTRNVPDGWYVLRVTADDRRDNPGDMARSATRQSSPVRVDTSAPTIEIQNQQVNGQSLSIEMVARDDLTPIREVAYTVDGQSPYQPVLPEDLIFDSTAEDCAFTIDALSAGAHTVTIRVLDQRGNPAYHAMTVNVAQGR
jgi:hypothetical protein